MKRQPSEVGPGTLLGVIVASLLLSVPVGIIGFTYWAIKMPAVPASKLGQMYVGMRREQVRQLLGPPRYDNDDYWIYERQTWAHLNVHFDADGIVRQFEHNY